MIRVVLDNGLTVIAHRMPVESETIYVFYNVGAKNEYQGIYGGSHLVEHMLFRRIEGLGKSVDELVEGVGGYFNGFTNYDYTAYVEVLPLEYVDIGFEIESKRMINAVFDSEEFELERKIVLSEFDMNENDTDTRLLMRASLVAWDTHPYRYSIIGLRSDLSSVGRDELYGYYKRFYHPSNATLVAVGGLDEDAVVKLSERYFGHIKDGGASGYVRPWDDGPRSGRYRLDLRAEGGENPRVIFAFKVPGVHDVEGFRRVVFMDFVLSGDRAFTYGLTAREPMTVPRFSRLYKLVDEGLCNAVYSYYEPTYMNNLYAVVMYNPRDPDKLVNRLTELILEKPSEEEVRAARERIESRLTFSLDSPSKAAYIYGLSQLLLGNPMNLILNIESSGQIPPEEYPGFVEEFIKFSIIINYG
ncbi:M16 family metallopeptidase [Vulcanisaeta thermophila]|uniref:M16 family metallopeptidase n=1 Tax=Vulcanisaeta thermophila TaxID=867917 RepID=UPI000A66A9FC|nr:pitrilysin family protein [Vulcanisaeta thermophila]